MERRRPVGIRADQGERALHMRLKGPHRRALAREGQRGPPHPADREGARGTGEPAQITPAWTGLLCRQDGRTRQRRGSGAS
eukprot:4128575-Pyramimonas_sp.AAC.1